MSLRITKRNAFIDVVLWPGEMLQSAAGSGETDAVSISSYIDIN